MPGAPAHRWDLAPAEAVALQRQLSARVSQARLRQPVRWVAGVDMSVKGDRARTAAVLLTYPDLELAEVRTVATSVRFPYIPGLLSFRECPAVLAALERLSRRPDLVLVDGQGRAHPRRFGIACHVGVLSGLAAIGCAKSRLCGRHREPGTARGATAALRDGDEVIGTVVRTRGGVKPLYVSVGHRLNLDQAVEYTLGCGRGYRLPEPARLAHRACAGTL